MVGGAASTPCTPVQLGVRDHVTLVGDDGTQGPHSTMLRTFGVVSTATWTISLYLLCSSGIGYRVLLYRVWVSFFGSTSAALYDMWDAKSVWYHRGVFSGVFGCVCRGGGI